MGYSTELKESCKHAIGLLVNLFFPYKSNQFATLLCRGSLVNVKVKREEWRYTGDMVFPVVHFLSPLSLWTAIGQGGTKEVSVKEIEWVTCWLFIGNILYFDLIVMGRFSGSCQLKQHWFYTTSSKLELVNTSPEMKRSLIRVHQKLEAYGWSWKLSKNLDYEQSPFLPCPIIYLYVDVLSIDTPALSWVCHIRIFSLLAVPHLLPPIFAWCSTDSAKK